MPGPLRCAMIANMAKPRSSSKGKTEGPDLFAFAADRGDGPRSREPAAAERAEPAAVADPAATAGQLLAGLDKLPSSDLLSLVSALGVEVVRRGLTPVRVVDEPASKAGARLKPSSASAGKSGAASIPTSKVNAIRAALKAGVKPGVVARQFGVSIAQIKKLFGEG